MRSILAVVLLLLSSLSYAQTNYAADLIPQNLKARAVATIRNEETVVDMRAPDNVIKTVKKIVTVYNDNGDDNARIVQYYNKNTVIKSIKGEIYNANGGLIGKFTQNDFMDESAVSSGTMFGDFRVKHYLPNINTYPYTVVSYIELRDKQNLIIEDWTPNYSRDISIEKSSYKFICKPDDKLRIQEQFYPGKAIEEINDKQKILTWTVTNVPATKIEAFMPVRNASVIKVRIAPENFVYFNKKGTYNNWDELGRWNYNELLKNKRKLPAETIEAVNKLLVGITEDKEKARKLYAYMQQKTRYISIQVGIGGFEPFPAAEVDQLGYGDCKALVNYMQSLLDVAGIPSFYCIVEAGETKINLDKEYANMEQGNHIILCMPLKGDTTWLECTSQKIPFGFLSTFTDDRNVLACTPDGGRILHTPKLTTDMNLQSRKGEFKIQDDGSIAGEITTLFKGGQYDTHEDVLDKPYAEQEKRLKEYYNINNIYIEKIAYKQDKSTNPAIEEALSINIRHYVSKTGTKFILKPNIFNVQATIPENRNRISPVYINRGYTDEDILTFTLPENFDLQLPENKSFSNAFGNFKVTYTKTGNKLQYSRKMAVNDGTFPAESYNTFFKFMADVNNSDEQKLILTPKS